MHSCFSCTYGSVPTALSKCHSCSQSEQMTARESVTSVTSAETWLVFAVLCSACVKYSMLQSALWLACSALPHTIVARPHPQAPLSASKYFRLSVGGGRVGVDGGGGSAATGHHCLWNEVKREDSPQPAPFCFHSQSLPLFTYVYMLRRSSPGVIPMLSEFRSGQHIKAEVQCMWNIDTELPL